MTQLGAVTWRPQSDLRIAAVTVAANDYYVLSGRSLKEVEDNEHGTLLFSVVGVVASLVVLSLLYTVSRKGHD